MNTSYKRTVYLSLFILMVLLFSYFRLKPLYFQTVPYTYDQGRDFLKAAEMVQNKDLTFIGPTTGINGIFHGAWWYYYLTIPFILFHAAPMGFYYANFFIHLVSLLILGFVLYRYFSPWTAGIITSLIAISPYFISKSIFVGNNNLVLPFLLLFLLCHFFLLEQNIQKPRYKNTLFALIGISLGLVAEFEFAFGLLLFPVYALLILFWKPLRTRFLFKKHRLFFIGGVFFTFLPRLLFELKNNFSQTRTLISFFFQPKLFTPQTLSGRYVERIKLFQGYYESLFPNAIMMWIMTVSAIVLLAYLLWKRKLIFQTFFLFCILLLAGLFCISLYYKDTFWNYYYEGLSYMYLCILAVIGASAVHNKIFNTFRLLPFLAIGAILAVGIVSLIKDIPSIPQADGLQTISQTVSYVQTHEKNPDNYCVLVYTPPAIPHTYNYLFLYNERALHISKPHDGWVNNQCWFIIESDQYPERRQQWIDEHIPHEAQILQEKKIKDTTVQLWSVAPTDI